MTPLQEVLNAISMLPIALMSLQILFWSDSEPTVSESLFATSILIHCPFSVFYHLCCAAFHGRVDPVKGNIALRFDLIFIHVSGAIVSLATSGRYEWFALNVVFNAFCSYRLAGWYANGMERRCSRIICAMGYIVPVLTVDAHLFLHTLLSFFMMVLAFALNWHMKGWGHFISHLLLIPFVSCLFQVTGRMVG